MLISPGRLAYCRQPEDASDLVEAERVTAEGRTGVSHADVAAQSGMTPDGRAL